jgi:nucleotide-binding universal stress UspA family protein
MRILIATHGSSDNENLFRFGIQIARRAAEPPTLLAVIEPRAGYLASRRDGLVAAICEPLQAQVQNVRTKVRVGRFAEETLREARAEVYDLLIVAGDRQGHPVRRWLPGSTEVSIAERAPCSVAVVKGKARVIRQVLLCDSGASGPAAAPPLPMPPQPCSVSERFARRLVDLLGRDNEVTVLHVMSQIGAGPGVHGEQLRASAGELIGEHTPEGELLERDVQLLERSGIQSRAEVRHGLVVDEILAEARSGDYDLVVIGAPAEAGWRRLLLDDLARKILIQMDRPVLIAR